MSGARHRTCPGIRVELVKKAARHVATDPDCAYVPDMGRPHRVQIAGGTYHVTSRGNRHQSIYHDDDDRKLFLALRNQVVQKCGWRTLAHCLLTNHFHLLIETPAPNLSV